MINIEVNGVKYNCISQFNEMTLKKSATIMGLFKEKIKTNNKDLDKEILFALSDIPPELIEHFSEEHIKNIFEKLTFLTNGQVNQGVEFFELDGKVFKILDLDELTVAQYAEIEYYFLNYKNEYEVLPQILNGLVKRVTNYRRNILFYIKKRFFHTNIVPLKLKKYTLTDYEDNSELFAERFDGAFGLGIYFKYIEWIQKMAKEYPLWPKPLDTKGLTEDEIIEIKREEELERKNPNPFSKWGMYANVDAISSSLQERDLWYSKNIKTLFRYLVFLQMKRKEEIKAIRNGGS